MVDCRLYPQTESEFVYEYNHQHCHKKPYVPDPINVVDINGDFVGYTWNYGDAVTLVLKLNDTVLHADDDHLEMFKIYLLANKELLVRFSDIRGNEKYLFKLPIDENSLSDSLEIKLALNYSEDTLIARNTYYCDLILNDIEKNSKITLLKRPYEVYVK